MSDDPSIGAGPGTLSPAPNTPTSPSRAPKDAAGRLWHARSFWAVAIMLLAAAACMAWVIARFNNDQAPATPTVSTTTTSGQPAKRVLVLNSFNPGYRWTDNMLKGINDAFRQSGLNVEVSTQFMDMKRIPAGPEHSLRLKDALSTGYRGMRFDAVLACDNDALEFLRTYRDELFPGTPLVFASINDFGPAMLDGRNDLTGTSEETEYRGTINDALKLRPATRKVVVVVDETTTGKAHRSAVRKIEPEYANRLAFEYLSLGDSTLEELAGKLAALPSDCVVLLLQHFRDRTGASHSVEYSTPLLTSRCPVPCLALSDIRVGLGALGGAVESGYRHGNLAAGMVVDILKGKDVRTIPVMLSVAGAQMFDYAVMRRFGIEMSQLPPNSVVLGRPRAWLEHYADEIAAIAAVIVLLSACVGLMGYQVLRRRRSELALRRSERHYHAIVDQAADGIFVMSPQGEILEVNDAFAAMHGYTAKELREVGLDGLDDPESKAKAPDRMRRILAGEHLTFDVMHVRKDGSQFPLEVSSSLVEIDGQDRIMAFHRDITERRRAGDILRESEQRYRSLVDGIGLGVMRIGTDYRIRSVNPAQARLFGKLPEDFIGKECFREFEKRDAVCPQCPGKFAMETGQSAEVERQGIRDDGGTHVARVQAFPLTGAAGQSVGFIEVTENITARKRAEEALEEVNEQRQLLLDGISDAFFAVDERMVVTYYNGAAERLLGRAFQDVLGRDLFDAFPEARGSVFETNYRRAIATKQFCSFEVYFDVPPFVNWYDVKVYPTRQGIAVFFQISTERKHKEAQLRHAQKMEAIGQLAGGVAHDFRNQLTVIQGFAEMLLRRNLVKEEGRDKLELILKAAERSATTTGQLLAYSRKETLSPTVQSLSDCVAAIGKVLLHLIAEDIRLVVRSDGHDTAAKVDAHLFQQAIINLATNARDAMPKGGTLTIETTCVTLGPEARQIDPDLAEGPYVVVSVRDTGVGMDGETVAKAFDPFFTTKGLAKGTGLGLAMVYGFVKQSGGAVALESQPGRGTTVRLYFPQAAQEPAVVPSKQGAPAIRGGGETVLLVEDEASVLAMAAQLLQDAGYHVLQAPSAEEALSLIDRHDGPVDALVSDIVMPGMGGVTLAEQLQGRYSGMAVVFVSGYPGEELAKRGVNDSMTTLSKPFTSESLLTTVRQALDSRRTAPGA